MKFKCGPTEREKEQHQQTARLKQVSLRSWHKWFAWYPVSIGNGECRWLEWVLRSYPYATVDYLHLYNEFKTDKNLPKYKALTP